MKALVLEAYNKLVYKDFPDPEVADDEVLVKVEAVGICGSDIHGLDGSTGRRKPPLVMGHEAAGIITALGKDVKAWAVGDRVTFDSTIYKLDDWYTRKGLYNLSDGRMVLGVSPGEWTRHGAFAELVNIPQHILYKIPEGVSFTQASMVEPVAVAAHAVELTPVSWNDTAVVVGSGMIGLFVIQVLRAKGCGNTRDIEFASFCVNFGCDTIDVFAVLMETIVGKLIEYQKQDEETYGHAYSQTDNIDKGKGLVFPEISNRCFQIVL